MCSIHATRNTLLHRGSSRHHRLHSALAIAVMVLSAPFAVFGQTPDLERESGEPPEESAAPLAAPDLSSYADPQLDQSLLNASAAAQLSAEDAFDVALQRAWQFAKKQLGTTATDPDCQKNYPMYTWANINCGNWFTTGVQGWTSGFFPGSLWFTYQQDLNSLWKTRAESWQVPIQSFWKDKVEVGSHDIGFVVFNSFGNGYRLTGNNAYRQIILHAAQLLANRYSPVVGSIRSWGNPPEPGKPDDKFQVIIDNMMNLELLFWASKHGGNSNWYEIAKNHALKTRLNHVRPDGSTYHLVIYNGATGEVKVQTTAQGYSKGDFIGVWSRGQAWAVYGFTMAYRYTKDVRFLETARKTADYFINNLPKDYVPYWDFKAPNIPNEPKDSSAAAIAAAGLLELSQLEMDTSRRIRYLNNAKNILRSLATSYLAQGTTNSAILLHGTYHRNQGLYDRGTIWGDYYFLEALLRYRWIRPTTPVTVPVAVVASANDGNLPGNAIDNNLATRWSANGVGQWIQFDLGVTKTIQKVAIAWHRGNLRAARFDIQVSTDEKNWKSVFSGLSSGMTLERETYDFSDQVARYIRVTGYGGTESAWNSITEFEAY